MMKTGMLWFDDDPKRSLVGKIERAAIRFNEKYGRFPDVVYANPITSQQSIAVMPSCMDGKIDVKESRSISPNHFWLGIASD